MAKIPAAIFPVDPSIGPDGGRYRYGVVVHVQCGASHNEATIYLDYDDIQAGTAAIQDAIDQWRTGEGHDTPYSPPPPPGDDGNCVYTGRIISIGRRSDVPMFPGR